MHDTQQDIVRKMLKGMSWTASVVLAEADVNEAIVTSGSRTLTSAQVAKAGGRTYRLS